jgi:hypothetical protein
MDHDRLTGRNRARALSESEVQRISPIVWRRRDRNALTSEAPALGAGSIEQSYQIYQRIGH